MTLKTIPMRLLILLSFLFSCSIASAQISLGSFDSSSWWNRLRADTFGSHFSIFTGPGVNNLGDRKMEADGTPSEDPIAHWVQLTFGKKINDNISFAINPRFTLYYGTGNPEGMAEIDDPVTGFIFNYKLSDRVSYFGIVNTLSGKLSTRAKEENVVMNPGDFHEITYRINNHWDVAARTFFRFNIYSRNLDLPHYGGWLGPKIEYYANDKHSIRYWMQQNINQLGQNSNYLGARFEEQSHYFSWHVKFAKWGMLPYVAVDSTQAFSASTAFLGAWIYGSIF
jgi:hypothetical protein